MESLNDFGIRMTPVIRIPEIGDVLVAVVPIFPNQYGPYMIINAKPVAMSG